MTRPDYFVKDGHTLGYTLPGDPWAWRFHILHASVLRGATTDRLAGFTAFTPDQLRPATLADFEAFRVSPKGHIA